MCQSKNSTSPGETDRQQPGQPEAGSRQLPEHAEDEHHHSGANPSLEEAITGYSIPDRLTWQPVRLLWTVPARLLIGGVRLYQIFLSPVFGRSCRFYPTCSRYYILSVRKYGAVSGSLRGVMRILRCHPFHPGGYDPP